MEMTLLNSSYPRPVVLRDSRSVLVRPMQPGEGPRVQRFLQALPEEERLLQEGRLLLTRERSEAPGEGALALLALDGEETVGVASLVRRPGRARAHVGDIGVAVAPAYRHRGLGSALLRELCEAASTLGLEKLLYEAVADLEADAIRAAEWAGFMRLCILEGGARDPQGRPHDVVIMALPMSRWRQWTRF